MAEVVWEDAPNDDARIEVWGCPGHIHMTVAIPNTGLGFNLIIDRHEAAGLASKIVDGLEAIRDATDANEYDTSLLYIA
jgi:hypothetical protein